MLRSVTPQILKRAGNISLEQQSCIQTSSQTNHPRYIFVRHRVEWNLKNELTVILFDDLLPVNRYRDGHLKRNTFFAAQMIFAAVGVSLSSSYYGMELDTEKLKENQETLFIHYLDSRNRFLYYSYEIMMYEK